MIRGALALIGGAVGWYAGMPLGYFVALLLSCVGTGFGVYYGRRLEDARA